MFTFMRSTVVDHSLTELCLCVGVGVADVDDLVREWVDLVVERDQLFREQLNQVSGGGPSTPVSLTMGRVG